LEESGRTATDSGSLSSEPVPARAQCSRPPNSRTTHGLKIRRSNSSFAVSCLAWVALEALPSEEIDRNAPDIAFVQPETAPIVAPGWATKKRAQTT
jgi:hypothetical protein